MTKLTPALLAALKEAGVECFLAPGASLPENSFLQPPCSLKWMAVEYFLSLGSFSYAVRGYYFNVQIGRYTSIGEDVQVGRGDHPTSWLSTSPAFYIAPPFFNVGTGFQDAEKFHSYRGRLPPGVVPTPLKRTVIGNDVYIGHGAFIRPGVNVGHGAVIGAHSLVLRDVPPYAVVAGNPASLKKFRVPIELIPSLLELKWWNYAPWQLDGIDITRPAEILRLLPNRINDLDPYDPGPISIRELAAGLSP